MTLLNKFSFYRRKYGTFHAICSYIGRHNKRIWKLVGPIATRRYVRNWLATTEHRILNLGGGGNCMPDCLTVDIDPRADAYVDVTSQLPFEDASIDAIFCEEVIEHVDLSLGQDLLRECWRVLVPGGVLRLTTPDLDWFAGRASRTPAGCNDINTIFYAHEHRYLYTQQALKSSCQAAGLINIKVSSYRDAHSRLGYLDSHAERFNRPPQISQYLEMEKPGNSIKAK
jgi:predicted SAM-dependent methyltransferase